MSFLLRDNLTANMECLASAMSRSVSEIVESVNQLVKANGEIGLALLSLSEVTGQGDVRGNVIGFRFEDRALRRDTKKLMESLNALECTLGENVKQLLVTAELALQELDNELYKTALERQVKERVHHSFLLDIARLVKLQTSLADKRAK